MKKVKIKQEIEEYRLYPKELTKKLGIKLPKGKTITINEVFGMIEDSYISIQIVDEVNYDE